MRSRAFSRGGTRSSREARARATTLLQSYARVTNVPRHSPLSRRIAPVMPLRRAGACFALFALIALVLAPAPCDAQTTKQARSRAVPSTPPRTRGDLPKRLALTRAATHRPASSLSHIAHRIAQASRRSAAPPPTVPSSTTPRESTSPPNARTRTRPGAKGWLALPHRRRLRRRQPCTGPYGTCVDGTCEEGGNVSRFLVFASISCTTGISHSLPDVSPPPARRGLGSYEYSPSPPSRSQPRRGMPVRRRPHGSLQVRVEVAHLGPVRQQGSAVQVRRQGDVRDQLSSRRYHLRRLPRRRSVQGRQAVLREQVHGCVEVEAPPSSGVTRADAPRSGADVSLPFVLSRR